MEKNSHSRSYLTNFKLLLDKLILITKKPPQQNLLKNVNSDSRKKVVFMSSPPTELNLWPFRSDQVSLLSKDLLWKQTELFHRINVMINLTLFYEKPSHDPWNNFWKPIALVLKLDVNNHCPVFFKSEIMQDDSHVHTDVFMAPELNQTVFQRVLPQALHTKWHTEI